MVKPYFKVTFITYILMFIIAFVVNSGVGVNAEENIEVNDEIFVLEMNMANFDEIKESILSKDVKYIVYPNQLEADVKLSEINESDIDYTSFDIQTVTIDVARYTNSKVDKKKIDLVSETVKIKFIDTIAPTIKLKDDSIEFVEGSSFNPKNYIMEISDNSFDEVKLTIDNPVDINKPGTYTVKFDAVDSSNNKSSRELSVKVLEKPKPVVKVPVKNNAVVGKASAPSVAVAPSSGNNVTTTLNLINQHRINAGLHPLQLGGASEMSAVALRAREAASYVSHTRPDGRNFRTAFTDLGISHNNVIEVLTYSGSTPAAKVAWWMSSAAHRSVLMRSDITHIAIGISGGMYAGIVYR